MNAEITAFRTRSQLGLRSPRSISRNITPQNGGVSVHWGGPRQNNSSHAQCESTWRSWQNFHMLDRGWVDIAYNLGFCNHGYVLAGRGQHVRSAANGTNFGNQNFYAIAWIGGSGQRPSLQAYQALRWCVYELRRAGNAGMEVTYHTRFTGSSCPGSDLTTEAKSLNGKTITPEGGTGPVATFNISRFSSWARNTGEKAVNLFPRWFTADTWPKENMTFEEWLIRMDREGLLDLLAELKDDSVPNWAKSSSDTIADEAGLDKRLHGNLTRRYDVYAIIDRILRSRR